MKLKESSLLFFVEEINDGSRETYEKDYMDSVTGVTLKPFLVTTGSSPALLQGRPDLGKDGKDGHGGWEEPKNNYPVLPLKT